MSGTAGSTPLIEQYKGVKAQYPGHLVLFRVGDFYETFGEDAKLLSRELEVVLTARAPDSRGSRLPMAGVPHHAIDTYLGRLVRKGYKVALCDQVEDARLAKGLVRRQVTRVVTPGTVVEDRILPGPDHNFLLAAVLPAEGPARVSAVDVSTGDWYDERAELAGTDGLLAVVAPFSPREILVAPVGGSSPLGPIEAALRHDFPHARLERAPEPISPSEMPKGIQPRSDNDSVALDLQRRLAAYVAATQPRLLRFLETVPRTPDGRRVVLDAKTLRHLEISRPMSPDDPSGLTLISCWDETRTAAGHRTLVYWLKNPLAEVGAIRERQDAVEELIARRGETERLRRILADVADLARIAARLAGRRLAPMDLFALRETLHHTQAARALLGEEARSPTLRRLKGALIDPPGLWERLNAALPDEPTPTSGLGSVFRPGFDPQLDRHASLERDALEELERLERDEQRESGIRNLKVGYNQVFGYYLEISRAQASRAPAHYRRKQTLSTGERFTTDRLMEIEGRILGAREDRAREETARWESFLAELEDHIPSLHRLSRAIGELDALASFAHVAEVRGHVRPTVDDSRSLTIRDGRHPVLDRSLEGRFVPNDTELDASAPRLLVITGPNMSGKSTYMRQVGLLVVLAQAGAFLPARFARLGVVKALFTRMGFTDEIGRGKSSFMVEMTEVSEILRSADERSLVLLDEVGRGTSTFDGLALAWATLRFLHDRVKCRTLLATHYHHLTELIQTLPGAANAHFAVRESPDGVVFLHRLVPGSTDRSYGLNVARLAGLPPELIREAERLLRHLEEEGVPLPQSRRPHRGQTRYTQAVLLPGEADSDAGEFLAALREFDADRATPMEALAWVEKWRKKLGERPPATGGS